MPTKINFQSQTSTQIREVVVRETLDDLMVDVNNRIDSGRWVSATDLADGKRVAFKASSVVSMKEVDGG